MTLSQLLEQLKALEFDHGDKEIFVEIPTHDYWRSRILSSPESVIEGEAVHNAYHDALKLVEYNDFTDKDEEDTQSVIVITL